MASAGALADSTEFVPPCRRAVALQEEGRRARKNERVPEDSLSCVSTSKRICTFTNEDDR